MACDVSPVAMFSSGPTDETGERRRGCFPCRTLSAMLASQWGPHLASNSAVWLARPSTFSCFWPKTELAFVFLRIYSSTFENMSNVQLLCLFTWGPLFQRNWLKLIYQCLSPTNLVLSRVPLILTILSKVDRTWVFFINFCLFRFPNVFGLLDTVLVKFSEFNGQNVLMTPCSESLWVGRVGRGLLIGPGSMSLSLWEARKIQNISYHIHPEPPNIWKVCCRYSIHFADPLWNFQLEDLPRLDSTHWVIIQYKGLVCQNTLRDLIFPQGSLLIPKPMTF